MRIRAHFSLVPGQHYKKTHQSPPMPADTALSPAASVPIERHYIVVDGRGRVMWGTILDKQVSDKYILMPLAWGVTLCYINII